MCFRSMLAMALALPLAAQDTGGAQLLQRVRAHMTETLAQQPNYTCLEAVERSGRGTHDKDFRVEDRIRLEVALVDGKEMFGWPGSKKFEDTDVSTFAPGGMFGQGDFALYSKTVFGDPRTQFAFRGATELDHRVVTQYDFEVPAATGMVVRSGRFEVRVGYHGSIFVDPTSLDVLRMDVVADALPRKLDLSRATVTLEYARQRIGDSDFLLPSASEAAMADVNGSANRNRTRFSGCREFAGESTLTFGDGSPSEDAPRGPAAKEEIQLPKNLRLEIEVKGSIDTDTAAVGDPVNAVLAADVKSHGVVLLPKGTAVSGRLIRLEHFPNFTVIGLIFQEATSATLHAMLNLSFETAIGPPIVPSSTRWGVHTPLRPHEGVVPVRAGHQEIGRNVVLFWRT